MSESSSYLSIEPSAGETYNHPGEWAVYRYDEHPPYSVLAGRQRRRYVGGEFTSEGAAKAKYPDAVTGGQYEPELFRIPVCDPLGDDPESGETWADD